VKLSISAVAPWLHRFEHDLSPPVPLAWSSASPLSKLAEAVRRKAKRAHRDNLYSRSGPLGIIFLSFFSVAQYSASDGSLSKSGLYPFVSYFERGTGMVVPVRNRPTPTLLRHETAQRAYAYSPCFAVRHTTACGRVVTINNERGFQTETHSHTQKPPRFPLTARAVALRLHAGVGNPPCRGGAVCVANVSGQRSPIASMCNWR
jgi:hypothetical protein